MVVIPRLRPDRTRLDTALVVPHAPNPQDNRPIIGILHQGGPANVFGAVVRQLVLTAHANGHRVFGFEDGFEGVLDGGRGVFLTPENTQGMRDSGKHPIGTVRKKPEPDEMGLVSAAVEKWGLKAFGVAGGDDTNRLGRVLFVEFDVPVFGIAKTVDDDLLVTEITYGHFTAVHKAGELLTTYAWESQATNAFFLVEIMGRNSGALTMRAAQRVGATWGFINEMFTSEGLQQLVDAARGGDMRAQHVLEDLAGSVLINGQLQNAAWIQQNFSAESMQTHAHLPGIRDAYMDIAKRRADAGLPYGLFVIAEGVAECLPSQVTSHAPGGIPTQWEVDVFGQKVTILADEFGNPKFSSIRIGSHLAGAILAAKGPTTKFCGITYEARCTNPVPEDIRLATSFGRLAAELAVKGRFGNMVGSINGRAVPIPFSALPTLPGSDKLVPRRIDLGGEEFLTWWQEQRNTLLDGNF